MNEKMMLGTSQPDLIHQTPKTRDYEEYINMI